MSVNQHQESAEASVRRAHKGKLFSRGGRGFSLGELKKAGIEPVVAKRIGLRVDPRRRSVHDFNIDILKKQTLNTKRAVGRLPLEEGRESEPVEVVEAVEAAE